MSKPWLGYLSAFFLLLAGVFQYAGGNPKTGIFFIVLSVVNLIIRLYIQKNAGDNSKNP
jgi:hypothetical protein